MRPVSGEDLVAAALQSSLARAQRNYNSSARTKFSLKKRLTPAGKGSGVVTESRGGSGDFGAVKSLIRNKKSLKFESEFSLWIQQTSEFNFTSEAYINGAAVPGDIECLNSHSSGDKKKNKSKNFQNQNENGSSSQPELTNGTVSSSLSLLKGKASQSQSQSHPGENSFELLRRIKESRKEKKKLAKIRKRLLKQGLSSEEIENLVSQCQTKNSGSDGGAISIVNKLRKKILSLNNKEKKKQEKENLLIQSPKNKKKLKKMKDLLENGDNSPKTPGTPPSTNHPRASTSASHSHSKSPQTNGGGCGSPVASGSTGSGSQSQHQLPQPKRILYPREKIVPGYQEKLPVGTGFFNMGNSCYLNASLQAVFHVPAFINWLRQDSDHRRHCQDNGSCTVCAMKKTLDASLNRQNSAPNAIRPVEIINRLRSICRHFSHGRQEDAHEFLRYLFESMERSYLAAIHCLRLDNRSKETNPLSQIFGGYIRTEVTCLKCNHVSTTFQPTAELQLDIRHVTTLEDAILNHFKKERLDNNDYKCEKCKTISQATKQFSLEVPPIVLCIQLKRFTLYGTKIAKRIHCNRYLDMSKYMHKSKQVNGFSNLRYRLVALVTHLGASANCGHYTAIAEASNGNFYQFDDSYVHQVTAANALNNDAYVIIYEMDKRPSSSGKDSNSGAAASTSSAASSSGGFTTNLTNFPSSTVTSSSVSAASASATMNPLYTKKLPSTPIPKISSSKLVNHNHTHENSGGGTKSESLNSNGNSNGFKTGSSLERNRISFGIRSPGVVTPKKINILKHSDVSLTGTRPASPKISSSSTSSSATSTSTSSSTATSTSMNSVKLVPYNDDENEESDKDESSTTVKRLKSPVGNRSPEISKCPKSPKPETSTSASASTPNPPQSSTSRSGLRSKSPVESESPATATNSSKLVPNETAERDTVKRKASGSDSGSGSASDRRRRHSSTSSAASSSSNSSNKDNSKRKGNGHKRKRSASRSEVTTATEKEKDKESRKSPPPESSSRDSQERDRERRRDRNPSRSPSLNKNGTEEKEKEKSAAGSVSNSGENEKERKSGSTTSLDLNRLKHENNIVGWNGRKSMLSMSMDDDRKRANEKTEDDEFDEEFDQGKIKKVRRSRSLPRESEGGGIGNRFQTVEDRKKEVGRWSHVAEDFGTRSYGNSGGRNSWPNGDHEDSSSFRHNSSNRGFGACSKPRHSSTGSSHNQNHVNNMGYSGMNSRNNQNHRSPFNRNGNGGGGGNQYRSQSYSSYNGGKHWINRHH